MDPVTLGAAKADAAKRYTNKKHALARQSVPTLLAAYPPAVSTDAPTRTLNGTPTANNLTPYNQVFAGGYATARGAKLTTYFDGANAWRNTLSNYTPTPWAVEFDYWGQDIALSLRGYDTGAAVWVWVDGRPVTSAPEVCGVVGSQFYTWRLVWGSTTLRRVRCYLYACDFVGFSATTATDAFSGTQKPQPRIAWLMDSWAVVPVSGHTQPLVASDLLGMEPFLAAQTGSGYVTVPASGTGKANYQDDTRIANITAINPHLIIVAGSLNDDGTSGLQAAAATTYAKLATAMPNVPVIVVGPQSTDNTTNFLTARTNNNTAVKTAALAAPNVLGYVDPVANTWVRGTGKVGTTTGVGPSDVFRDSSGAHMTQSGALYYGRRTAQGIADLLAAAT